MVDAAVANRGANGYENRHRNQGSVAAKSGRCPDDPLLI
jgi:hypothetical protein